MANLWNPGNINHMRTGGSSPAACPNEGCRAKKMPNAVARKAKPHSRMRSRSYSTSQSSGNSSSQEYGELSCSSTAIKAAMRTMGTSTR